MQEQITATERFKNYFFGGGGVALSLADITGVLQFIAALAGAVLVCRQLWRDFKRKKAA